MMKVKAVKPGFFGKLREPGDEFEVPEGAKATWFKPIEPAQPVEQAQPVAKATGPTKAPASR